MSMSSKTEQKDVETDVDNDMLETMEASGRLWYRGMLKEQIKKSKSSISCISTYKSCFIGSEGVNVLINNKVARSRFKFDL